MLAAVAPGYLFGVASQLLWPVLPEPRHLLACGLILLLLQLLPRARWRVASRVAAGVALGMAMAAWQAGAVMDARLPPALEGTDTRVDAEVLAITQHADGGQTLMLSVRHLPWPVAEQRWQPAWRLRISSRVPLALQRGEHWQLPVRLRRPRATQNPGVADFERYLLGERVVATGYLREDGPRLRLQAATGIAAWRAVLLESAWPLFGAGAGDLAVNDAQRFARAVLPALVLDERSLLSGAQWRVLADTGTAHLVAISGLHVALLWGGLLWLAALALRRRPGSLRYRALAVLPALTLAVIYAALAGMPLPAARAVLMLTVASLFLLRAGQVPVWRVWLFAGTAVLLTDPLAVHAAGFWLSFGAVGLLLLIADLQRRPLVADSAWKRAVVTGLQVQVALSLLLSPLLFALFGAASVSSVPANLPAIPLVNLLALPAGLLGFALAPVAPSLADPCLDFALAVLALLWELLVWIDRWPALAPLALDAVTAWSVLCLCLLLPLLWFAGSVLARLAVLAALVLVWPRAPLLPAGVAEACVLDVGQGLSAIIRTRGHAVIYDTGPAWGERDAGASVVVPAARALGIRQIDTLVLSHDDNDHAGGAASVVAALAPRHVLAGDPKSQARLESHARLAGLGESCATRRRWQQDGVRYSLFPGADDGDDNDRSCVLHVAAGRHALLLTGDSSQRRELALLEAEGDALRADVLVAGHHGSRSATSATFLYRVAPVQVIFPAGHGNRFGHPHPEVQARARRVGAATAVTGEEGALCFRLGEAEAPVPAGTRYAPRVFWRDRARAAAGRQ